MPGLVAPNISYQNGQGWLHVSDAPGGYQLVADASHLSAGTYIALFGPQYKPLPAGIVDPSPPTPYMSVSLTVGLGLVQPADVSRVIGAETAVSDLSGTVPITVQGGPPVTWNATSNVPWLTVSSSGTTGSAMTYTIDPAFLHTVQNYSENVATIRVTAPATSLTPMSFHIKAIPQLPEVVGVGGHVQLAGRATKLIVAGRGFGSIANANLASRLGIVGATAGTVQRISDTKMVVDVSSLSVGTHEVSVSNALGIATATGSTVAVSPTTYAYATVATGQRIDELVIDDERGVIYGVHVSTGYTATDGNVRRFNLVGSTWVASAPQVPGASGLAVQHDGDLLITKSPGALTVVDATTFAQKFSLDLTCVAGHRTHNGFPVTLDGRVWLGQARINPNCVGSPLWGELGSFDPVTRKFQLFQGPGDVLAGTRSANGPDLLMARNGERLVIDQMNGSAGSPINYLDVSEGFMHTSQQVAAAWEYGLQPGISADGNRLLIEANHVLDAQLNIVGHLDIPPYTPVFQSSPVAQALSPDGTRAYVLVVRASDLGQPSTTVKPRVIVYDTSGDVGPTATVPVRGFFELNDYPSCLNDGSVCQFWPAAAISLDGNTLFFAGSDKLVVAPIPPEGTLTPASVRPGDPVTIRSTLWRVPSSATH